MFSEHLEDIVSSAADNGSAEAERVRTICSKAESGERLSLADVWELLNVDTTAQAELAEEVIEAAHRTKEAMFARKTYPISPLYVTSICQENCLYCNFRAPNKDRAITRLRLTEQQLRAELEYLINEEGLRVIELVYSGDPAITPEVLSGHIRLAQSMLDDVGGGIVGINAAPYQADDYRLFLDNQLDFVVLWQETYDKQRYKELHPGRTPKTFFERRVDSYEAMIEGGIAHVGMGVLSGLAKWRKDWLALMAHERYLQDTYGTGASLLGIPRLKSAQGAEVRSTDYVMNDAQFLLALAVHNLFSPETLPFVNTREGWDLCVEAARGGGAVFTFNCATIPGGYSQGTRGYQFPTDSFPARRCLPKLRGEGLEPVISWDFETIRRECRQVRPVVKNG